MSDHPASSLPDFPHDPASGRGAPVSPSAPPGETTLFRFFNKYYFFFEKAFTIVFAFLVFASIARHVRYNRDLLSYIGIILMVTVVYLETLVIRDHLWVLEGAIPEARRWRDVFFSRTTLSQQRWRKMLVVLFAAAIFAYVYLRTQGSEIYSFMGIILMVTVLYFEVLGIRDEVTVLSASVRARLIEESVRREEAPVLPAETEPGGLELKDDD